MALNGRLSNDDLATIPGTNHRVRKDLLAQTVALRAAFQKALGFPLAITDSYRQYSGHYYAQVETFLRYYTRTPQPGRPTKVWNGVTYWQRPGFPMAATPGRSNHGWGTAIDFGAGVDSYGSKAQKWMAANASRFGWYWPAWAQKRGAAFEPWHYEATPVLTSKYRSFLSSLGVDVPSLPDPLEDDMPTADEIAAAVWAYRNPNLAREDAYSLLRRSTNTETWGYRNPNLSDADAYAILRSIQAQVLTLRAAGAQASPTDIARALAPLLTPAITTALGERAGISAEDVEAAAERAVRGVLGSLDES